jgi:hypothetical protein
MLRTRLGRARGHADQPDGERDRHGAPPSSLHLAQESHRLLLRLKLDATTVNDSANLSSNWGEVALDADEWRM